MSSADRHETTVLDTLSWDPQVIGIFIDQGYTLPCVMTTLFCVFAFHSLIESGFIPSIQGHTISKQNVRLLIQIFVTPIPTTSPPLDPLPFDTFLNWKGNVETFLETSLQTCDFMLEMPYS